MYSLTAAVFEILSAYVVANNIYVQNASGNEVALGSIHLRSVVQFSNCEFRGLSANKVSGFDVMESTLVMKDCLFEDVTQTAIYATQSTLTLSNLIIQSNSYSDGFSRYEGTGLTCYNCIDLYIFNSTFLNLTSTSSGAGVYIENDENIQKTPYVISSSYFESCSASSGGAVYVNNANFTSLSTIYTHNAADTTENNGSGGGIELLCSLETLRCIHNLSNNSFIHNYSNSKGGAISWSDIMPNLEGNLFHNNSAIYGENIASYPITLEVLYSEDAYDTFNVVPGQPAGITLFLKLIDHYGQIYAIDNRSTADLIGYNYTEVNGEISVAAEAGWFTFKDFTLLGVPDSDGIFEITSSAIPTFKQLRANDSREYVASVYFNVYFRECVRGEYSVAQSCDLCESGKYSLDPSQECKLCPSEAECYGNFTIVPKKGYWRSSNISDSFYRCPNGSSCLGGEGGIHLTGKCEIGYQGNLCNSCEEAYAKLRKFECLECSGTPTNGIVCAFTVIGLFVLSGILLVFSLRSAYIPSSKTSIYLKIFINYLHLIAECTSILFNWPRDISWYFKYFSLAGDWSLQTFSLDCMLKEDYNISPNESTKIRLIILLTIPFLYILGYILIWLFTSLITRKISYLKNHLICSISIFFLLIHPTIVKLSFSIYGCRELEDGEYWLDEDSSIRCWGSDHTYNSISLGLPILLIWTLGMPILMFSLLMMNRRGLKDTETRVKLGYLYNGYKPRLYYWEFVISLRKVVIITCSVYLLPISPQMQSLPILLILTLSFILQIKVKPFVSEDLNRLEAISIFIGIVTIYFGMYYLLVNIGTSLEYFIFTMILISNVIFVTLWMKYLIFGYNIKVNSEGYTATNASQKYMLAVNESSMQNSCILPISDFNSNSEISYNIEDMSLQAPFNTFAHNKDTILSEGCLSQPDEIDLEMTNILPSNLENLRATSSAIKNTEGHSLNIPEDSDNLDVSYHLPHEKGRFFSSARRISKLSSYGQELKVPSEIETGFSSLVAKNSIQSPTSCSISAKESYGNTLKVSKSESSNIIAVDNSIPIEALGYLSEEEPLEDSVKCEQQS
jgi:hypothetical protein